MRKALLALLVLGAVLLAAIVGEIGRGSLFADSYSSLRGGKEGLKALYLTLHDLGVPVKRLHEPPARARHTGVLFVVLSPHAGHELDEADARALVEWAEAGNTLVVAHAASTQVLDVLRGVRCEWPAPEERPEEPVRVARADQVTAVVGLERAVLRSPGAYEVDHPAHVVLLGDAFAPAAVSLPKGDGRVVLVSDPWVFSNQGLTEEGNLELALGLAGLRGRAGGVAFDESVHGFRTDLSTVGYLRRKGLGPAFAQLVLAALAALWLVPPRRLVEERQGEVEEAGTRDFLDAMARVYAGGRFSAEAAADLAASLRSQLRSALKLEPASGRLPAGPALARLEPRLAREVDQALARGESGERLKGSALVGYHNQVLALIERVRGAARAGRTR